MIRGEIKSTIKNDITTVSSYIQSVIIRSLTAKPCFDQTLLLLNFYTDQSIQSMNHYIIKRIFLKLLENNLILRCGIGADIYLKTLNENNTCVMVHAVQLYFNRSKKITVNWNICKKRNTSKLKYK